MMVLYSGTTCPFSHRCRFVLFEKGMDFEIRDVDLYNKPEDISVMNPYGQVPILVERDLILETLKHCLGNRTHAANILGISIRTLRNKLNEYSADGSPIPPAGGGEAMRGAA